MSVLGLFLVFSHLTLFVIYRCFGKYTFSGNGRTAERRQNGRNGYIRTIFYGTRRHRRHRPTTLKSFIRLLYDTILCLLCEKKKCSAKVLRVCTILVAPGSPFFCSGEHFFAPGSRFLLRSAFFCSDNPAC